MGAPNPYFLKLTASETMRFVELCQNEEILWNTNLEHHRNRPLRQAAAQRISNALNIKGFSAKYVFLKFKNLRSSYCQELKKIVKSIAVGQLYRPKVCWFPAMNSYLRPFVQSTAAKQNLYLDSSDFDVSSFDMTGDETDPQQFVEQSYDQESSHSNTINENEPTFLTTWNTTETPPATNELEDEQYISESPASEASTSTASKRRKLVKTVKSDCGNFHITNGNDKGKIQASVDNTIADNYDCFGKYVASLLRSMPEKKAYRFQLEIATKLLQEQINDTEESRPEVMEKEDCASVEKESEDEEFVDLTTEINDGNYLGSVLLPTSAEPQVLSRKAT